VWRTHLAPLTQALGACPMAVALGAGGVFAVGLVKATYVTLFCQWASGICLLIGGGVVFFCGSADTLYRCYA